MELIEEEKKAIEHIKNIKSWWWNNSPDRVYTINKNDIEKFDVIINLIEKQQKEIEELQKDKKVLIKNYDKVLGTFICKDKIREFIKKELPDDEAMECCTIWDVNGIDLRIELEKLLEEQ